MKFFQVSKNNAEVVSSLELVRSDGKCYVYAGKATDARDAMKNADKYPGFKLFLGMLQATTDKDASILFAPAAQLVSAASIPFSMISDVLFIPSQSESLNEVKLN